MRLAGSLHSQYVLGRPVSESVCVDARRHMQMCARFACKEKWVCESDRYMFMCRKHTHTHGHGHKYVTYIKYMHKCNR